jgi:hypothetical protein
VKREQKIKMRTLFTTTIILALVFSMAGCASSSENGGNAVENDKGYIMADLSEKLVNTEGGIWTFSGVDNDLHYIYVLQFYDTNKICFSYDTRRNEYEAYTNIIQRKGTFTVENDILTANFTSLTGSQYNSPNPSDEPLSENLSQRMEMEITERTIMIQQHPGKGFYLENPDYDQSKTPEVEATEYKLIVKQVRGNNLFENQNEKIEFIAERPIID